MKEGLFEGEEDVSLVLFMKSSQGQEDRVRGRHGFLVDSGPHLIEERI